MDANGNGFLEKDEIANVVSKLGIQASAEESKKIIQQLDYNKDGCISLEEFRGWWLTGRQGMSASLQKVLFYKVRGRKLFAGLVKQMNDG